MLRKILVGTTALLCSQLAEAKQKTSQSTLEDFAPFIFSSLIPLGLLGMAKFVEEYNKVLPIWKFLYYRAYAPLEEEVYEKTKDLNKVWTVTNIIETLREYEKHCDFNQSYDDRINVVINAFRPQQVRNTSELKVAKTGVPTTCLFPSVKANNDNNALEKKVSKTNTTKPRQKKPGKKARMRAALFGFTKTNNHSGVQETKRNTKR